MVVHQRREYIALADLRHTHIESTAAAAPLSRSPWHPSSRGRPLSDSRPFGSRKACRRPHFGDRQLHPDGAVRSASVRNGNRWASRTHAYLPLSSKATEPPIFFHSFKDGAL